MRREAHTAIDLMYHTVQCRGQKCQERRYVMHTAAIAYTRRMHASPPPPFPAARHRQARSRLAPCSCPINALLLHGRAQGMACLLLMLSLSLLSCILEFPSALNARIPSCHLSPLLIVCSLSLALCCLSPPRAALSPFDDHGPFVTACALGLFVSRNAPKRDGAWIRGPCLGPPWRRRRKKGLSGAPGVPSPARRHRSLSFSRAFLSFFCERGAVGSFSRVGSKGGPKRSC